MKATRDHFRQALTTLEDGSPGVTTDLEEVSSREIFAEIFLQGKSRCRCRIWQGGLMAENSISYAEGSTVSKNSGSNEILSVAAKGSDVFMQSLMGHTD